MGRTSNRIDEASEEDIITVFLECSVFADILLAKVLDLLNKVHPTDAPHTKWCQCD